MSFAVRRQTHLHVVKLALPHPAAEMPLPGRILKEFDTRGQEMISDQEVKFEGRDELEDIAGDGGVLDFHAPVAYFGGSGC